ncbi:WD40-repeat-containing domain protein [Gongronella butleri]|nr:WD40-repeat-containing domain protein [Gongronella butleri]
MTQAINFENNNTRAMLENATRSFSMLTQNDTIDINDNGNIHEARTAEVKPQNARAASVSIDGDRPFVEAQGANSACLQFDDEKMIAGMDDNLIDIYGIQTGRHLRTLEGHKAGLWDLKYVGNTLVSSAEDYTVRVWDIAKGKCTHVFREHEKAVRSVNIVMPKLIDGRMQPAEPWVVSASDDNTLRVWRLPNPVMDAPFCDAGVNP